MKRNFYNKLLGELRHRSDFYELVTLVAVSAAQVYNSHSEDAIAAIKPAAANNDFITQTVYGFLDFTTTIGNTVMVFSPQSAPPGNIFKVLFTQGDYVRAAKIEIHSVIAIIINKIIKTVKLQKNYLKLLKIHYIRL